jgi:hypothetical protein
MSLRLLCILALAELDFSVARAALVRNYACWESKLRKIGRPTLVHAEILRADGCGT